MKTVLAALILPLRRVDWLLLLLLAGLLGAGLVTLFSASLGDEYFNRQVQYMAAGAVLMLLCAAVPWEWWKWTALQAYLVVLLLLVAVELSGTEVNNSKRWLDLGFFSLQPSELMKVALPLMLAVFYSLFERRRLWHHCVAAVLILIPAVLVLRQPDLGTAVMVLAAGAFVVFFAGLPVWLIGAGAAGLAMVAPVVWTNILKDYQRERFLTVFDPYLDPMGAGYHTIQANIAVGSGGVWGKGWGLGSQSQLGFLPERHTDFIFAVLAEEFGLAGSLSLLALFLLVLMKLLHIAAKSLDDSARLFTSGFALMFFTQCAVNLSMVSGLLPVVGLPLPMVSYGGTAVITFFAGFGMAMSVANQRVRKHVLP